LKKLLWLLPVIMAAAVVWGLYKRNAPPVVSFARVQRETLVSTLPTNGKVEPYRWQAVHAEISGLLNRLDIAEGQRVAKSAVLGVVTDLTLQGAVDAAEAKVTEARANVASLEAGLKPGERTEIENNLAKARLDLEQAKREQAALERLAQKQAATSAEVTAARDKVQQLDAQIAGLEKRRSVTTAPADLAAARARLQDMQAALRLAQSQAAQSQIVAPMDGVVYGLAVKSGAYVKAGDLLANIGEMDRLRVRVYIDEPELGRVSLGQPVTIAWQALPGKQWQGTVEQKPASIETLGSRQVGQVICTIENPGRILIPGTNVDATIRTAVVDRALVIPKETLRHDAGGDFVYLLKGDALERRPVKTGNSSVTRIQITDGLAESDSVAMPSDIPLKPGDHVVPASDSRS
jgi:HlyD family secretion protein